MLGTPELSGFGQNSGAVPAQYRAIRELGFQCINTVYRDVIAYFDVQSFKIYERIQLTKPVIGHTSAGNHQVLESRKP